MIIANSPPEALQEAYSCRQKGRSYGVCDVRPIGLAAELNRRLLPIYFNDFIEGCGGDPHHPWNRHLCSTGTCIGPRREQEQDVEGNGEGCFPTQLTVESERAS